MLVLAQMALVTQENQKEPAKENQIQAVIAVSLEGEVTGSETQWVKT